MGILSNLFGGGKEKGPKQPKEAFFLDDDSAKSLGDIDYMRNPSTVRRTFPKTVSSPEKKEYVQETSAMDKVYVQSEGSIPLAGGVKPKQASAGIQPKTFGASSFAPAPVPTPVPAPTPAPVPTPTPSPAAEVSSPEPETPTQAAPTSQAPVEDTVKRSPDSSMDMFRNMAKNMPR